VDLGEVQIVPQTNAAGRGLDGVAVTTSAVSSIIGSTLTYRGIDIDELAEHSTFEEVAYLLWYGDLPGRPELDAFRRDLAENRRLGPTAAELLRRLPPTANTMTALRLAVSALELDDPDPEDMAAGANRRTAIRLLAVFPTAVAAIHRLRRGEDPVVPDPHLDEATNLLYMLTDRRPSDVEAHAMDVALILHADHELNASTFAARVTASTLSDIYSAVVAALCALKGSLHGGANGAVLRALQRVGSVEEVPGYVRDTIERKERFMGFGHRVYKDGDPRARWLKILSSRLAHETGDGRWFDLSSRLEEEVGASTGLLPNVDFYSASVFTYLGIPIELFTPIFATSRVAGWIAHILEQYQNNRLIRPRAEYVGPERRPLVPISER